MATALVKEVNEFGSANFGMPSIEWQTVNGTFIKDLKDDPSGIIQRVYDMMKEFVNQTPEKAEMFKKYFNIKTQKKKVN